MKVGLVNDDALSLVEGLKLTEGTNILLLTSLGFSGDIPLFLKPLNILTGVTDSTQVLPTSDAITSEVITLPGLFSTGFSVAGFEQLEDTYMYIQGVLQYMGSMQW